MMMIDRPPKQIGMRELRDRFTPIVEQVQQGEPYVVLSNNTPIAVLLPYDEIARWKRVEFHLSTLHGLEIYPEAARGTSELGRVIRRERRVSLDEMEAIFLEEPHQIMVLGTIIGISEARTRLAGLMKQVPSGKKVTVVAGGEFAAEAISPIEYQRLQRLHLIYAWFQGAGLDLLTTDALQTIRWVREYRARPSDDDGDPAIA